MTRYYGEMATDEENAINQREAAAVEAGMDSPGATAMAAGGDAPQPIDESDPSAQSSSSASVQSDPAMDDSAGGDMPSEAGGIGVHAGAGGLRQRHQPGRACHHDGDGRPAAIDAADTVVEPGPAPAPAPAPSGGGTPAPSTSQDDKTKDCRDEKPGGATDLPNRGWVLYGPLGANGRATGMQACLSGYKAYRKTDPQVRPVRWDAAVRRAG